MDFVVKEGLRPTAINVCLTAKAPARETASLLEFAKKHRGAGTLLLAGEKKIGEWLLSVEKQR